MQKNPCFKPWPTCFVNFVQAFFEVLDRLMDCCCVPQTTIKNLAQALHGLLIQVRGFSLAIVKCTLSITLPFSKTNDLDFSSLKLMLYFVLTLSTATCFRDWWEIFSLWYLLKYGLKLDSFHTGTCMCVCVHLYYIWWVTFFIITSLLISMCK